MDWNSYSAWYPERYLKRGPFDEEVDKVLRTQKGGTILEIGGGPKGCHSLREKTAREGRKVYTIEPFTRSPVWADANLSWEEATHALEGVCDFIIARGVLNYLMPSAIARIPYLLSPGGVFLANTFREFPKDSIKRVDVRSENQLAEEQIVPIAPGILEHTLIVKQGATSWTEATWVYQNVYKGTHRIYHHSMGSLEYMLVPLSVSFQHHKSNSVVVTATREESDGQ